LDAVSKYSDTPEQLTKKQAEELVKSIDASIKKDSQLLEEMKEIGQCASKNNVQFNANGAYEYRLGRVKKFLYGLGALTGLAGIVGGAYDFAAQSGNYISTAIGGAIVGGLVFGGIHYGVKRELDKPKKNLITDLRSVSAGATGALFNGILAPAYLAILTRYHNMNPDEFIHKFMSTVFGGPIVTTLMIGMLALYVGNAKEK